ncbi:histidine phosphatase family protein [Curtobacterium flaccumfaciens]|nr:histidine phosphatase family protein [Curtobacterium flaccumfaciens]
MTATNRRKFYLVRHGETHLNAEGRIRGLLDVPLTERGWAEADAVGVALVPAHPVRVVTGPLARARETAGAIAEHTGAPVVVDDRYVDRDYGRWSGQIRSEVIAQWGSVDDAPGVEPVGDVVTRCTSVLEEQMAYPEDGPIVLVGHDATNRALLAALFPELGPAEGIPQRTACWNLVESDGTNWRLLLLDQKPGDPVPEAAR